jgi:hypothetical protein
MWRSHSQISELCYWWQIVVSHFPFGSVITVSWHHHTQPLWGVDYKKPMRTCHKHSYIQLSTDWVWHGPSLRRERSANCNTAVFPELFKFREVGTRFLLLHCHTPVVNISLFTTEYKKLAEGGLEGFWWRGFLMGDWLVGCCCWVMLEIRGNMRQCKSEHWGFKKS